MFSVVLHRKGAPAPALEMSNLPTLEEAEKRARAVLRQPDRVIGLEAVEILENGVVIKRIPVGTI